MLSFIVNANERMELEFLRQEVNKLKGIVGVRFFKVYMNFSQDEDEASENESVPSDEDEYIDDLPAVIN